MEPFDHFRLEDFHSKKNPVRREALYALERQTALNANELGDPSQAIALLDELEDMLVESKLASMRDIATRILTAIAYHGVRDPKYAEIALPGLLKALELWGWRQANRACPGLAVALRVLPDERPRIAKVIAPLLHCGHVTAERSARLALESVEED
jgi:hypothetical protein